MTQHLLVVEDSPVQAELLRGDLAEAGYEVSLAGNGHEALEQLEHLRPDAIVSDVMMPQMGGYELCRRLKADRELAEIPVVLLTSLRDPVDIVRGLECGADNFITKPYELEQLLHRLDTVLRSRDLRASGRFRMGVEVLVLGHTFTVSADRQQILDMLMSSFEELVNANDRLREREEELRHTQHELTAQVALSERHRRELEESKAQIRNTLDVTGVATWRLLLPEGRFEWSENAHAILGLSPDAPIEDVDGWLDQVVEEDRRYLAYLIKQLQVDPEFSLPEEWQLRIVGTDRVTRTFAGRHAVTEESDDGVAVSGIAIDVTRRRQLEQELEAREETLQGVFDTSPDGIVVTDLDGRVGFASAAVRDLLGVSPDELVGRHLFDYLHPEDRVRFQHSPPADGDRGVRSLRVQVANAEGHSVTVDARTRRLVGDGDRDEGLVTVLRDVSEQAVLEAELEQARDEAERANQAKSEYLSRMSHELRTPMNSVLGFAQLLELSELEPEDRDSVDRILAAGRHLLQLIDDVLDIARIEAGRMTVSLEPVSVETVVGSAVELVRPQVAERQLSLTVDPNASGFPHVLADQQRLSQVLINLLTNAVKYNREGGAIEVTCEAAGTGWYRIAVSDTGYGISPEYLDRLFSAFDRLGADRTNVAGTGLGLALSQSLIEAMGGRIGCESTPDVGSTFWVELPAAPEAEERPGPEAPTVPAQRRPAQRESVLLYIEDNALNLELAERALGSRPATTLRHATSGEQGLELAAEIRPDLVLLDLHLPGASGREVLRQLRDSEATRETPVVVVSADATTTSTAELLASGADGYLTKPLDLTLLRRTVDDLLEHGRRTGAPERKQRT